MRHKSEVPEKFKEFEALTQLIVVNRSANSGLTMAVNIVHRNLKPT